MTAIGIVLHLQGYCVKSVLFFIFALMKNQLFVLAFLLLACGQVGKAQNSQDTLIPFRKGDKWGFSDTRKNIKIKPIFDKVEAFYSDEAFTIGFIGEKRVLIASDGTVTDVSPEKEPEGFAMESPQYGEGFTMAMNINAKENKDSKHTNGRKGYKITCQEDVICEVQYAPIYSEFVGKVFWYDNKMAILRLKKNSKLGVIDTLGKEIVPFKYEKIRAIDANNYIVTADNLLGLQSNGELKIPTKYSQLVEIHYTEQKQHLFWAKLGKKFGIINSLNEIILPFEYDDIVPYASTRGHGFQIAQKDTKTNVWNVGLYSPYKQKIVVPCKYAKIIAIEPSKIPIYLVETQSGDVFYIDEKGTEYYEK